MSIPRSVRLAGAVLATATVAASTSLPSATASAEGRPPASDAPKNVIVLIGDGMGYNSVDQAALYAKGVTMHQVAGAPGKVAPAKGTGAAFPFQKFPVRVGMSTYSVKGGYDPKVAWGDMAAAVKDPATDSAAASTAMATGVKTYDAGIGVDKDKKPLKNAWQAAKERGKATGVVSSVPFSHATPAGYVAHNESRNNYHALAEEMIDSDTNVIIGAGHPYYNDDHKRVKPNFTYLSERDFGRLEAGDAGRSFLHSKKQFDKLARNGVVSGMPKKKGKDAGKMLGLVEVGSTLQQGRSGEAKNVAPFSVPMNDVPRLATLTEGALNVLDKDRDGFYLMVEGGAIDWAGHANSNTRNVEETLDFTKAVDATIRWVEKNSSWKETLVIVTADHETGYLTGPGANPNWTAMSGKRGELPAVTWQSGNHSNQLVPVYARGKGADMLYRMATKTDPVRGRYLDNTDLAKHHFAMLKK